MNDSAVTYFFLCGSALLAGAVNSIAGGGTLLTFPALLHALNGNGVLANGTSTVAVVPGSLAGAWGYRKELRDKRTILLQLLGPCLLGGALGVLLAAAGLRVLSSFVPSDLASVKETGLNGWVLGFTLVVSFLVGLICGLIPAVLTLKQDLHGVLKEGTRTAGAAGGPGRQPRRDR